MKSAITSFSIFCTVAALLWLSVAYAFAGPFNYGDGYEKYPGILRDDSAFIGWAIGYLNYSPGPDVEERFQTPDKAIGQSLGGYSDIVSLGSGGSIIMSFDPPIQNGNGWDFAVFENGFWNNSMDMAFLELAYVEISSDGEHFVRFDNCSLTSGAVGAFENIDPSDITGLAGKYVQGIGTPFDLEDLIKKDEVLYGFVDLNRISYVKIIDIMGDGTYYDHRSSQMSANWGGNSAIYDPYPSKEISGFDLEAIGVRYQNADPDTIVCLDNDTLYNFDNIKEGLNTIIISPSCHSHNSWSLLKDIEQQLGCHTNIYRFNPRTGLFEVTYWFFNKVCGAYYTLSPGIQYKIYLYPVRN